MISLFSLLNSGVFVSRFVAASMEKRLSMKFLIVIEKKRVVQPEWRDRASIELRVT